MAQVLRTGYSSCYPNKSAKELKETQNATQPWKSVTGFIISSSWGNGSCSIYTDSPTPVSISSHIHNNFSTRHKNLSIWRTIRNRMLLMTRLMTDDDSWCWVQKRNECLIISRMGYKNTTSYGLLHWTRKHQNWLRTDLTQSFTLPANKESSTTSTKSK